MRQAARISVVALAALCTGGPAAANSDILLAELGVMLRDVDPALRLQAGLATCLGSADSPDPATRALGLFEAAGWQEATPNAAQRLSTDGAPIISATFKTSFATLQRDGWLCQVSDMDTTRAQAEDAVRALIQSAQIPGWSETTNAKGCTQFEKDSGRRIAVFATGTDNMMTCAADSPATIRLFYEGQTE